MLTEAKELFDHYKASPKLTLRRVLFERLVSSYESSPEQFQTQLLNILYDFLPLKGCALYSYHPDAKRLCLLAQKGFSYSDYDSFEIDAPSIANEAAEAGASRLHADVFSVPIFRSLSLATSYNLRSAVVLPLTTKLVQHLNKDVKTLAVVSMYPSNAEDTEAVFRLSQELEAFLGSLYHINLQLRLLHIRDKVIKKAYTSADMRSCLHKVLRIVLAELNVEAGSVFLYDTPGKQLILQSTTGIETELGRMSIYYTTKDKKCLTWRAFNEQRLICVRDLSSQNHLGKYLEVVSGSRESFLAQPITSNDERHPSDGQRIRRTRGVLRLVNKRVRHGSVERIVGFSWEDKIVVEFVSDMIAAIVHMFSSRDRRLDYFEQVMHGASMSITACLANLSFLEAKMNLIADLGRENVKYFYLFKDTQTFLQDIRHQVERLSFNRRPLKSQRVELGGEVLSKTVALFESVTKTHSIRHAKITNLKENGFLSLPPVRGDPDALLMVFRNLVENAIRYRRISQHECIVELEHSCNQEHVVINFRDYGIGIPEEEKGSLFEEGYRAENAIAQYPASTGLGLHQTLDLLRRMGGNIRIASCSPATFQITLQKY